MIAVVQGRPKLTVPGCRQLQRVTHSVTLSCCNYVSSALVLEGHLHKLAYGIPTRADYFGRSRCRTLGQLTTRRWNLNEVGDVLLGG